MPTNKVNILKKALGPATTRLDNLLSEANEIMKKEVNADELTVIHAKLQSIFSRVQELRLQLGGSVKGTEEDEFAEEVEVYENRFLDATEILALINAKLNQLSIHAECKQTKPDGKNNSINSFYSHVKLADVHLPYFSGEVLEWKSFWDAFEVGVHKQPLDDVVKFTYLSGQLTGTAKRCISGLKLSSENYKIAIDLLQERYGNSQLSVHAHYTALRDIFPCNSTTASLRNTYDLMELHVRSLEALGEDTTHRSFVSLICSKLPKDILIQINNDKEDMTTEGLRQGLKKIITRREEAEMFGRQENRQSCLPTTSQLPQRPRLHTSTEALTVPEKSPPPGPTRKCLFCYGNHWNDECSQFDSVEVRKAKILCEIENVLNSRPLTYVGSTEIVVLTPVKIVAANSGSTLGFRYYHLPVNLLHGKQRQRRQTLPLYHTLFSRSVAN